MLQALLLYFSEFKLTPVQGTVLVRYLITASFSDCFWQLELLEASSLVNCLDLQEKNEILCCGVALVVAPVKLDSIH